ncbi:hypothetical protein BOX15_Mlig031742g1 [Macrostomum lignano]|uniref:5'-nucleotidase n=1 Tax=Macrostomum lignano TaxID=282301 RepID=A0A267EC35_9PLAT|nr:hypothetical protein BOX15_Mlig031742g1 [Macrostomum lignano]
MLTDTFFSRLGGLAASPRRLSLLLAGAGAAAAAAYLLSVAYRRRRGGGRSIRGAGGAARRRALRLSVTSAEPLLRLLEQTCRDEPSELPVVCQFGDTKCRLVMKNRRRVLEKLQSLMSGGPDALEVITDFDHTLSKFSENGRRVPSSHGIMESYPDLSAEDHKYFRELYTKYYAIEICPDMSDEEKLPHMIEWWTRSHDRMVLAGFQKSVLAQTVDVSGVALRDGWHQFFDRLEELGIPCLIFSAGIGDIIQEILVHFDIRGKLIRVVSNFMLYNEKGVLRGFSEPLIHTFNKRFSAFASSEASANDLVGATDRRHVLLMGDTMGDLRMSEGCNADLVLTVGYLNDRVQDRLSGYADKFDIVCLEDPSLCVPLAVIEAAATVGTA